MKKEHIVIIGTGPAGLIAAYLLQQEGYAVTLCERAASPGRKLLLAGMGGLNLTHSEELGLFLTRYRAAHPEKLLDAVRAFPPEALVHWCESDLSQPTMVGSSRRIYPKCMKASPVVRACLDKLIQNGARFIVRHHWQGWDSEGALIFATPEGDVRIKADATLLALGGASWPRIGTDGGWVPVLEQKNIAIASLKPCNMGVNCDWSAPFVERFEGMPVKSVDISFQGENLKGEAIITRYGLQGGSIYAFSSALRDALERGETPVLMLDGKPDLGEEILASRLAKTRSKDSLTSRLRKAVNISPVMIGLLREGYQNDLPKDPARLAHAIKHIPLTITGTQGFARAISTSGGVSFEEIDDHYMLKKIPGSFVAGEMLDWDAPTGGYLLQGCFATGVAAAKGMSAWLRQKRVTI